MVVAERRRAARVILLIRLEMGQVGQRSRVPYGNLLPRWLRARIYVVSRHSGYLAGGSRPFDESVMQVSVLAPGSAYGVLISPMGDGGGRLARFVGALMECRVRIGSPPRVRGRRRQIRDAAVRRGIVPLLHGPRPHRPDPHAPSPLVVAVRRISACVIRNFSHDSLERRSFLCFLLFV